MNKLLLLLIFLCTPLLAQELSPASEEIQKKGLEKYYESEQTESIDYQSQFFQMLLWLGLIIVGLFIAMHFFKKMLQGKVDKINEVSTIKIVDQRNLSAKAVLYIVEVYDKHVLVAETAQEVTRLAEFPIVEEETTFSDLMDKQE